MPIPLGAVPGFHRTPGHRSRAPNGRMIDSDQADIDLFVPGFEIERGSFA
jgi:hypothetical protein